MKLPPLVRLLFRVAGWLGLRLLDEEERKSSERPPRLPDLDEIPPTLGSPRAIQTPRPPPLPPSKPPPKPAGKR
jgi:hypothetical protein